MARAALRHALSTVVEENAGLFDRMDVAAEPGGLARADLVEYLRVDHRSFGKEAVVCWGNVFEVAVEEEAEDGFRNPREEGFLAKNVEGEKDIDHGISGNDPEQCVRAGLSEPESEEYHFSDRANTLMCSASVSTAHCIASTALAPPPTIRTFLPLASLPSSLEEWKMSPWNFSWSGRCGTLGSPHVPTAAMMPSNRPLLGLLTIQRPCLSFEIESTRVSNFVRSSSP